jgi:Tfp pilus assembly protein PilW
MRRAGTKPQEQVDPAGGRGRQLRSELGFTTFELMVALSAALVVIVIPLVFMVTSIRQSNGATSRALSTTQAETGLLALTRDLREASSTATFTWGASSATATFSIPTPGDPSSPESITWSCTFGGGSCTRQVGTSAAIPEIKNVVGLTFAPTDSGGNALSSPATNPAYVGVTVEVQNASSLDRTQVTTTGGLQGAQSGYVSTKPITLTDGAYLRNDGS